MSILLTDQTHPTKSKEEPLEKRATTATEPTMQPLSAWFGKETKKINSMKDLIDIRIPTDQTSTNIIMTENTTKEDIAQEENPTKTNNPSKETTAAAMTTTMIGKMNNETTVKTTKKITEESTIAIIIMRTNMIETNPEELNGKRTFKDKNQPRNRGEMQETSIWYKEI